MSTDGRMDDGRTPDAGVTGILKAHLGAFGSGELINDISYHTVSSIINAFEKSVKFHFKCPLKEIICFLIWEYSSL